MKIAVVSDSKTEHLSQCLGLRQLLKEYKNNKDVFILNKDLISLPGFLERLLTIVSEKIYLFFLRLVNPNLVDLNFILIDTAGIDDTLKGSTEVNIRQQCQIAINDANIIFFVIDGREGVLPVERSFAKILKNKINQLLF